MKKLFSIFLIFVFFAVSNIALGMTATTASYNATATLGTFGANATLSNSSVRISGGAEPVGVATSFSFNQRFGMLNYTYVDITPPTINSTGVNLSVIYNSDGSATLSWNNDTQEDVIKYNIYRNTSNITAPVTSTYMVAENITTLTWTDTFQKTPDQNYYYVLTAVDMVGNENLSAITNAVNITTLSDCTNQFGLWSGWGSCISGSTSRTRTRTCYINEGTPEDTESKSCTSAGASTDSPPLSVSTTVSEIKSGIPSIITLDNPTVAFYEASVTMNETLENIKFTFKTASSMPEDLKSANSNEQVFRYLEITLSSGKENVKNAKLKFKVEKAWLVQNSIDKSLIKLHRYTSQWDELKTKISKEDSDYVYYEADAPGFSYFKISALNPQAEPQNTPTGQVTSLTEPPLDTNNKINLGSTVQNNAQEAETINLENKGFSKESFLFMAVAILILGGLGFFMTRKKQIEVIDKNAPDENSTDSLELFFENVKKYDISLELARQRLVEQGFDKDKVTLAYNDFSNRFFDNNISEGENNVGAMEAFLEKVKAHGISLELARQRLIEKGFEKNKVNAAYNGFVKKTIDRHIPHKENNIVSLELFFEKVRMHGISIELARQRLLENGWSKRKVEKAFSDYMIKNKF